MPLKSVTVRVVAEVEVKVTVAAQTADEALEKAQAHVRSLPGVIEIQSADTEDTTANDNGETS